MEKIITNQVICSSDRNLKENISDIHFTILNKLNNIKEKSFNFKDDADKRTVYGIIAQDVQKAGLDELVYTKEDGTLAVDYTSYLILKIAKLEKVIDTLVEFVKKGE
jgi:hypothetical protein